MPSQTLKKYGEPKVYEKTYAELTIPREGSIAVMQAMLAELPVEDLLVEEVEIEEVVRRIFQKQRP